MGGLSGDGAYGRRGVVWLEADLVEHGFDFRIGHEKFPDEASAVVFDHNGDGGLIQAHLAGSDPGGAEVNGIARTVSAPAGAALADDVRQCDGLVDMMSYWTFDDVFEETGPVKEPFYGGFGLIAAGGIKKPSYYGYALLHKLGRKGWPMRRRKVIVTRRVDRTLVAAMWNVVDPDQRGATRTFDLEFRGISDAAQVWISRVDDHHSNTLISYERMGKPRYPTYAQIREMNRESELATPEKESLEKGHLVVEVPPNGLVVLEAH